MPAEMVRLAAAGDEAAFTQMVALHHLDMVRLCRSICADPGLTEDAVQAAWSLAWRRLPSLRDPARLRPWLLSIAANQARDSLRRARRRPVVELSLARGASGDPDPSASTGDLDLRNAMARLDPRDRAIVALRYISGFDSFEIGRAVGLSAPGVRARLARILQRLRSDLDHD